jgi:hypothetical protein
VLFAALRRCKGSRTHKADVGAEAFRRSGLSLALPVLVTIKVKEYNEAGGEGLMRHDRLQKYGVFYEGLTDPRAALECDRCLPHSVYGSSLLRNFPKFRRAVTTKLTDRPSD